MLVTRSNTKDIEMKLSSYLQLNPVEDIQKNDKKRNYKHYNDILIVENVYTPRAEEIINFEMHSGRWKEVTPIKLVQTILESDDPFVFSQTYNPALDRHNWPSDNELEKLLKNTEELEDRIIKHLYSGLEEDMVVMGAAINLFSKDNDVSISYQLSTDLEEKDIWQISTIFGRSSAFYFTDRYDPNEDDYIDLDVCNLTLYAGGNFKLMYPHIWCYPSIFWQKVFCWEPSPTNPFIWFVDGKPDIRMERISGPTRDIHSSERFYRQPALQRWVCKKYVIEDAEKILGQELIGNFDIETMPFKWVIK